VGELMAYKHVRGVEKLLAKFHDRRRKAAASEATVRNRVKYALAVHEKRGMVLAGQPRPNGMGRFWDPQGQATAGFLEKAVRKSRSLMQPTIVKALRAGRTLQEGLATFALIVMKEAQRMTPVMTGKLKAGFYVTSRKK
jgi:hypothetical protein